MTHGIGHNNGPELGAETGWRRFAWTKARASLLPVLPVEVVRLRVRRASELGLPYKTYAGVRAQTGRDVIGFLFSTNALRLLRASDAPDPGVAARLAAMAADRTALARAPLTPAQVMAALPLHDAHAAPRFNDPWPAMRDRILTVTRARGLPADGVILVGETPEERDWVAAGKLAAFLTGDQVFGARP